MPLNITGPYQKSLYEIDLESSIDSNFSSISSNTTLLDAEITTLSGNITVLNDFIAVTISASATCTLDLTTYRNFTITNDTTAGKTLEIANSPTAADTMLNVNVKLTFSATATFTYTGTITWSIGTAGVTAAPDPSAVGTFIVNLKSFDAGVNWLGTYVGLY